MTIARRLLVDRSGSGIYHCLSRCVRQAFLCGDGHDNRKDWIRDRLIELAGIFAIDVGGYAVMSNHLHVIARTHPERAETWTPRQVVQRWSRLFPKSIVRWAAERNRGKRSSIEPSISIVMEDRRRVAQLRDRLSDLSWFNKCLKEPIAKRANREDRCKGHFWEGRFKSQTVLDVTGLLKCMVYVDLNVIRALLAETPEQSDHTSVQDRIVVRQHFEKSRGRRRRAPKRAASLLTELPRGRRPRSSEDGIWLAPIAQRADAARPGLLPLTLDEYLQVVDASGRLSVPGKPGVIPAEARPILERLSIDADEWSETMRGVGRMLGSAVGGAAARTAEATRRGTRWVVGALESRRRPPAADC